MKPAALPGDAPLSRFVAEARALGEALTPVLLDKARNAELWCIFDNTAAGAAMGDALALADLLRQRKKPERRTRRQG